MTTYRYEEIEKLIAAEDVVGQGLFGSLYRGVLRGKEVAVEVLSEETRLAALEDGNIWRRCITVLAQETEALSRFRHPNIVRLMGEAEGEGFRRALVFELCGEGTLEAALSREGTRELSAAWLLSVAVGVARGLAHMHGLDDEGAEEGTHTHTHARAEVLHRDVRANNVGLCHGVAKLMNCGSTVLANNGFGAAGCIAPEITEGYPYSARSEIFAFGVLLLRMLTALHAAPRPPEQPKSLLDTIKRGLLEKGELKSDWFDIFDKSFRDGRVEWERGVLELVLPLALRCVQGDPELRPASMGEVLRSLCAAQEEHGRLCPSPQEALRQLKEAQQAVRDLQLKLVEQRRRK